MLPKTKTKRYAMISDKPVSASKEVRKIFIFNISGDIEGKKTKTQALIFYNKLFNCKRKDLRPEEQILLPAKYRNESLPRAIRPFSTGQLPRVLRFSFETVPVPALFATVSSKFRRELRRPDRPG